jgi:flagellar motor switch protein FliN
MEKNTTDQKKTSENFGDINFSDMDSSGLENLFSENNSPVDSIAAGMGMFNNIPLSISLEVASTEITLGELSKATVGDVIVLNKAVSEPLDVKVNGVLFARAEVVMVDGRYGLKFVSDQTTHGKQHD